MKNQAVVIIPTYNEAENIEPLVQSVLNLRPEVDVLVVDDHSPDGTGDLADRLSQIFSGRVFVLHRPGKLGLGTAHRDGFRWGIEHGYERLVTMDADFSHPPEAIPLMLEQLAGAGMVIGSRYVKGGRTEGWSLTRKLNSWTANFLARRLMGLKAKDCTGAFRSYRAEYLKIVPLEKLVACGYSAHLEVLYYFQRAGAEVAEVPITFVNRQEGQSKISGREIRETFKVLFFYFFHRPRISSDQSV
ncbi:MAG: polyprenol monophosphomannose synthase [Acidobacteriota bacterium]|nr:polyprenol monophosphomannose synthase [Acidobacteriota bacterium]